MYSYLELTALFIRRLAIIWGPLIVLVLGMMMLIKIVTKDKAVFTKLIIKISEL